MAEELAPPLPGLGELFHDPEDAVAARWREVLGDDPGVEFVAGEGGLVGIELEVRGERVSALASPT